MNRRSALLPALMACALAQAQPPVNDPLDYGGFARNVAEVGALRESRRISEAQFMRMARLPGTVVLDARSERLYRMRHVEGAVNLSLPEFTEATLAAKIPGRDTRVLIYCNNNFDNAPDSFPVKALALNLSTFVSLHAYGYRNVYELAPVIDIAGSKLAFAGTEVATR
jgi:hypothetical protein